MEFVISNRTGSTPFPDTNPLGPDTTFHIGSGRFRPGPAWHNRNYPLLRVVLEIHVAVDGKLMLVVAEFRTIGLLDSKSMAVDEGDNLTFFASAGIVYVNGSYLSL